MDNKKIYWKYIHTRVTKDPKGIVIFNHGYRSYGSAHREVKKRLLESGYNFVPWDQPGHGRSSGPRGVIENYEVNVNAMLYVLAQVAGKNRHLPIYILGHSFGCSIATLALGYLHDRGHKRILSRIHKAVYVAPAFHVLHNVGPVLRSLAPLAEILFYSKRVRAIQIPWGGTADLTTDETVARIIEHDPLVYHDAMDIVTAFAIHRTGQLALKKLAKMDVQVNILHGDSDTVVGSLSKKELASLANASVRLLPDRLHNPFDGKGSEETLAGIVSAFQEAT